jgi:uncharacterized protein
LPDFWGDGTWEQLAAQMEARSLDALAAAAGVPFPAVAALDAKRLVRSVPPTPEQILALRLAMPELTASVIPPGTYPSLNRGYETVGLYNFAVAHKDLPVDLVYRIVDTIFDRHEEMLEIHPAAAATVPGNFARNSFLPYHDGAVRYYGNTFGRPPWGGPAWMSVHDRLGPAPEFGPAARQLSKLGELGGRRPRG